MPTPSEDNVCASPVITATHAHRSSHITCPPEGERTNVWIAETIDGVNLSVIVRATDPEQLPSLSVETPRLGISEIDEIQVNKPSSQTDMGEEGSVGGPLSPMSTIRDSTDDGEQPHQLFATQAIVEDVPSSSSLNYDFSKIRVSRQFAFCLTIY